MQNHSATIVALSLLSRDLIIRQFHDVSGYINDQIQCLSFVQSSHLQVALKTTTLPSHKVNGESPTERYCS